MIEILNQINDALWGYVIIAALIGCGLWFTWRTRFVQFRMVGEMLRLLTDSSVKPQGSEKHISSFQAFAVSLASRVGTGNLAGVATAIAVGGPGAVFWMWLSAIFGMVTKYAEVLLSVKYRERNEKGDWVGGPMYYIKNGLGKGWAWLGAIFCVFGFLAAFGIGNMTQINTIASSINTAIDAFGGNVEASTVLLFGQTVPISSIIIGVIAAIIVALVLIGGLKRIGQVTEKLVPVMAVIYIVASIIVLIVNIRYLGQAFGMIFGNAFTVKAAFGGAVGIAFKTIVQKGVARGVFSNEAGLGSAPIAHAATSETDPVKQGVYGIFEVFMDTIVICTLTALVVLLGYCSGAISPEWGASGGTDLVSASFGGVLGGKLGALIVAVGITLFALSTLLSWSLYGTRCFEYLFGVKASMVYKIIFVIAVVVGATLKLSIVWDIADTLNGLMAIPNLIALLGLSGVVIKITKDHFSNKENLK